ncbi:reverse transcriptase domain protein [Stemphylium lycopersici]|uniref:Reverse transcriptase domain protein n=1 Tax=Stemphylium lycopersici TaxID=183478 RepID=A0A364MRH8_STELY|nr:reverse transcriptase domain protein [Stemphylium lycopersici]RAR00575.1 reverse transcriptase domain protein [Stemphylium lycopersici]
MATTISPYANSARLKGRASWQYWYTQFKFNAKAKGIWETVNPDAQAANSHSATPPKRPRAPSVDEVQSDYEKSLAEYRVDAADWQATAKALQNLWDWVYATVDEQLLAPVLIRLADGPDQSLQELVKCLKKELAPTEASNQLLVRQEYRAILEQARSGSMEPQDWYNAWQVSRMKAEGLDIPEVLGELAVVDFLSAVGARYAPEWANTTPLGKPTQKPTQLTKERAGKILNRLHIARYSELRKELQKSGHKIPQQQSSFTPAYPGGVVAAILDPAALTADKALGVYYTRDFEAHELSESTILDSGAAVHLVNSKQLLEPGSFEPTRILETVEAGTQAFPISGRGTRVLKGVLNGPRGKRTEDLTLTNVAVVEGFHLNIVSEARLQIKGVWYLGLDNTLRMGSLEQSIVLAKLERRYNLSFIEYKPLSSYPRLVMNVTTAAKSSWTTHPRSDSPEIWHQRAGHLGPRALEALVEAARGVRIKGIERVKCKHCAQTHAKQVISRRPKERAPRPYWRISWDLFDMPEGRLGEQWIQVIKDEYSGKLHVYVLHAKSIGEIMRTFYSFEAVIKARYKLWLVNISQDNDPSTLPWRGTSQFQQWCEKRGITIEPAPPHTHEPNGAAERAGQELITKSIKMRSSANLPEKLWPEIVQAAAWLYNISPSAARGFKSPNEMLDQWTRGYYKYYQPEPVKRLTADLRPDWSGVYAYGSRAYPLNKDRAAGRLKKSFKTLPRGHIGYLVGYQASNIYRIWVPALEQVITTRNVTFDESLRYEGKTREIPKEDAILIVNTISDGEISDAAEAIDQLVSTSQASVEATEDFLQAHELQVIRSVEGPSQILSSSSNAAREARWADASQRSREQQKGQPGPLPTPETTPAPPSAEVQSTPVLTPASRAAGRRDEPLSSRELQEPGGSSSTDAQRQRPQEGVLASASEEAQDAAEVPDATPGAPPRAPTKRTYTKKVWGPPKRQSARLLQQRDPEMGGEGAHSLIYNPLKALELENLLPELEATDRRLTTVHAVVGAATRKEKELKAHFDDLPKLPNKWKDLYSHQYGALFRQAAQREIDTLLSKGTWVEQELQTAVRPLPLKWVFTYKTDADGCFQKCKARLVVRGDLQAKDTLHSTYAATLASRSFRMAMAIAAEFDMEIRQLDVVGAFLNAHINSESEILCDLPDGYKKAGRCVKLRRALYGLRDSPLLWYNEFSSTLEKLNLHASKEEPCLFFDKERRILLLFYVDDILLLYNRAQQKEAYELLEAIKDTYEVEDKGEASWFLGMRIVRDHSQALRIGCDRLVPELPVGNR